jgi:aerobic-type carbon monoxide dehydrogenase small subunit (CoxS/CutS family)
MGNARRATEYVNLAILIAGPRHVKGLEMAEPIAFELNGEAQTVEVAPDTPLLYVLRNEIGLNNPHFGCGLAQCGACTVHLDGAPARSCSVPISAASGRKVTTLAGLGRPEKPHPLQAAFIAEQVPQCGYCLNGWIMTAAALLRDTPHPSEQQIREGLSGLKCRCGMHMAILRAVRRAAQAA